MKMYTINWILTTMGYFFGIVICMALFPTANGRMDAGVKIEIQPKSTCAFMCESVHITCNAVVDAKEIVLMSISKDRQKPLAMIRQGSNDVLNGHNDALHYQGYGEIGNDAPHKFLNLTLLKPRVEDAGTYTCTVVYLDKSSILQQDMGSSNLTIDYDLDKKNVAAVLTQLLGKVSELEAENKELRQDMSKLSNKDGVMDIVANISNMMSRLEDRESLLLDNINRSLHSSNGVKPEAFSATIASDLLVRQGDSVVFPVMLMSEGDGYNQTTGIFTARRRGLYVFHLAIGAMTTARQGGSISIQKNGVTVATTLATDYYHWVHASCSTVVNLDVGDKISLLVTDVYNSVFTLRYMNSETLSVFTGYLIQPL